jgi:hypothetical protein
MTSKTNKQKVQEELKWMGEEMKKVLIISARHSYFLGQSSSRTMDGRII